ncbi:MAG: arginine--tRNA ligase, partial [Candidatus Margulisiibacteriota bacterium]|nr:arginine--tRNA ligase [Candidatus Margulisiibacteriota bacterium]
NDIEVDLKKTSLFSTTNLNGYINIKLNIKELYKSFIEFMDNKPNCNKKDHILLEYVSANPTGPLHIGHGRWAAIGDSLYRLLKATGYNVSSEFYINDAGNQIKIFNDSIEAKINNEAPPENGYGGHFLDVLIENKTENETNIDYVINYQKQILKKMNCSFDKWFKETTLHEKNILEEIKQEYKDYIYEQNNAIWFKTTKFNDEKQRVIQKENGDLTYLAADIVYHMNKIKRGYNNIINIWGADHHGYVERISSVIKASGKTIKFNVILGQLVHLYKNGEPVKMSKRTGELIELAEVINEIGADATRFFLLEKKPEMHLDFDLAKAQEKNMDNPVFYIQYAHARICAIITKINDGNYQENNNLELNNKDRQLMLYGSRYYDSLLEHAEKLEVHKVATYIYNLCKIFHSFYKDNKVIYDNQLHLKRKNILLVTKHIITHCLEILGVSCPEKM